MSGVLPNWLAQWLGIEAAGPGEGTLGTLQHSWPWSTLATLAVAAAIVLFVGAIYRREAGSARKASRFALAALRIGAFATLLLMLAEMVLLLERTGLPTLVVMIDDSASMATIDRFDDSQLRSSIAARLKRLELGEASRLNLAKTLLLENNAAVLRNLASQYRLRLYFASETARLQSTAFDELPAELRGLQPEGQSTRLGHAIRTVLDDQRGAAPAAIVLFSDGITTSGETLRDISELLRRKAVPLYTVGLGSSKPAPDLALTDLSVDEVVFVDDLVNFEVKLVAAALEGRQVDVVLREEGVEVARQRVKAPADLQPEKISIVYRPTRTGDFQYTVEVEKLPEESNHVNNVRRQVVSVRKAEIKVLFVQQYPNYEFRFLKQAFGREIASGAPDSSDAIRKRGVIDLRTVLLDADSDYSDPTTLAEHGFPVRESDLLQYDVLIFGDVSPRFLSAASLQHISDFVLERGRGLVFIAGPQFTPLAYRGTPLAPLFPVELAEAALPNAQGTLNEPFVMRPTALGLDSANLLLADSARQSLETWQRLPPLFWMLEAPARPIARVLAEHPTKVDAQGRPLPVISLMFAGAGKVLFHATDETWRWRFRRGDELFARYWLQTFRMLSRARIGERSAELTTDRREYRSGENVQLRLRFQDDRLAPAADDGASVVIEQPGQNKSRVRLQRSASARGLFEGTLAQPPVGQYRAWVVEPALAGEVAAEFSVSAPPGEMRRTLLDERELASAATATRGQYYTFATAAQLIDDLPSGKHLPVEALPPISLWDRWPLLTLFLLLVSTEWILRKRSGMV